MLLGQLQLVMLALASSHDDHAHLGEADLNHVFLASARHVHQLLEDHLPFEWQVLVVFEH